MRIVLLVVVLLAAMSARANVVYSYVGNPYEVIVDLSLPTGSFDTSMRVTGSFELATPLAAGTPLTDISADVLDFSFFDGRNTLTRTSPRLGLFLFYVETDAAGAISVWDIIIQRDNLPSLLADEVGIWTQNDAAGALGISGVADRGQLSVCDPPTIPRGLCTSLQDSGSVTDRHGRWTSTTPGTPVSEPSSAQLALGAMLCLALAARRTRGTSRSARSSRPSRP